MNVNTVAVKELDTVPQYMGGSNVGWFRHTVIGDAYRVGSLGNVSYRDASGAIRLQRFGYPQDWWYESVVTRLNGPTVTYTSGLNGPEKLDVVREMTEAEAVYKTEAEAVKGHEALVAKYRELAAVEV